MTTAHDNERNALIRKAALSRADHGLLTVLLDLDYDGSGQGFGGFGLYRPGWDRDFTGLFVWRVMDVTEVDRWDALVGRPLRVRSAKGLIVAVGHYLKDKWFYPAEELKP